VWWRALGALGLVATLAGFATASAAQASFYAASLAVAFLSTVLALQPFSVSSRWYRW
jgi:hypothetical protein